MKIQSLATGQPLLGTKVVVPMAPLALVSRARLHRRLDQGLNRKLTILSAPAGSGKTMLLADWSHQRQQAVAWLALDNDDNDPVRFWLYVCAALQTLHPTLATRAVALLQASSVVSLTTVITHVINDLSKWQDDVVLMLDDYHVISTQEVHESLIYLLDHAPSNLHVYVASRADPPLSTPRLRVRGQLGMVRAADLYFTDDETATFLNESMGLTLAPADMTALQARTEGWIAPLHLAALSMRGQTDIPSFIRSFTGSNRYVVDYLAEEIYQHQSLEVQRFLLETSILERLSISLCDAVTQTSASAEHLALLEREVLVVSLDTERHWYRYHDLFGSFLRNQLQYVQSTLLRALHQRASAWYAAQELPIEAMAHALASADWEAAADLLENVAEQVLLRGDTVRVQHWLDALPPAVIRSRVPLCLVQCQVMMATQQHALLAPWVELVDQLLGNSNTDDAIPQTPDVIMQRGQVAALHGTVAYHDGDMARAIGCYQHALDLLPASNQLVRSIVAHNLVNVQRTFGDVAGARKTMAALDAASEEATTVEGLLVRASLQLIKGHLRAARQAYRQLLQISVTTLTDDRWLGVLDAAPIWIGALLYEWNDLQGATEHITQGIEQSLQHENRDVVAFGQLSLALVQQAQGGWARARELREEAFGMLAQLPGASGSHAPSTIESTGQLQSVLRNSLLALHARLALAQGDVAIAERWAARYDLEPSGSIESWHDDQHLVLARIEQAQGKSDRALRRIALIQRSAVADERWHTYLELLIIQSAIFVALDDTTAALHSLRQALVLAEPEGYLRKFVDEGPVIHTLLLTLRKTGVAANQEPALTEYIDDILEAFGAAARPERETHPVAQHEKLVEPLTERERDVLARLAQGLSNAEIADSLIVAVSTVRTHIKNIYGKLEVRNRVEAVSVARDLDLLT